MRMHFRPTRHRLAKRLGLLLFPLLAAWIAGLIWFAAQIPDNEETSTTANDAIVVLTGGSERLGEGVRLLAEGQGKKLFVSGVYRGVDVRALLRLSQDAPEELACCITLGYEADDTRGNARETAAWIAEEGYSSLRLVTAAYHMPRSLLLFRRAMPDVAILPHPVFPEGFRREDWWLRPRSAWLLINEYSKFLVAVAVNHIRDI